MGSIADFITASPGAVTAVREKLKLTWSEFLSQLIEIDTRLIAEGLEISARPLRADMEICRRCGRQWSMMAFQKDPITEIVHDVYKLIYGAENLYVGSLHVGAIMVRDAFFEVHVPYGYGTVHIDFWNQVQELSEPQKHIFAAMSREEYDINTDQIIDIFDFAWTVDDLRSVRDDSSELLLLAKEQIEGACRTLRGSFSRRVAIQGAAYAVELTAKALLAQAGVSKNARRKSGHDLGLLLGKVERHYPNLDSRRCRSATSGIPSVIEQRYNRFNQTRSEVGAVLRNAQFLIAEMARQVSERDFRSEMEPKMNRVFPS